MLGLSDPPSSQQDDIIKDTTTKTFREDVLAPSLKRPVLVDFWAPWCGPCKDLAPVLEKLVKQAGGKVRLVKMDIEAHPQIAGQLGIQSIPAVIAFTKGQPVDGFMGALPESQIKGFIERLIGPLGPDATEQELAEAAKLEQEGKEDEAAAIYANIVLKQPDHAAALIRLAHLHVQRGEYEEAQHFLDMVPEKQQNDSGFLAAKAALDLALQTGSVDDIAALEQKLAANPLDHQARFDLALACNAKNRREEAAEHLLFIIKRVRAWQDDGARKQLVQFFEAWGVMDEATQAGRRRLSSILFA